MHGKNERVASPSIIKESDGTYKMWYGGYNGTNYQIGYANSSDGIVWEKYAANPVMNLSYFGWGDKIHVFMPDVIKDGGTYKMWYTGHNGTYYQIGYANSSDGITWTPYAANPVLKGSDSGWDSSHIASQS